MQSISPTRHRAILEAAQKLLRTLFQKRSELWATPPADPLALIDPEIIITKLLGVRYSEPEEIFAPPGQEGVRIAGYIDRQKGEIAVAQRFKPEVRRFTAAHEIGHWVLHPGTTYFRDAPLDGSHQGRNRPIVEREADIFAAALLIPEALLREKFYLHFGEETLANRRVDEELMDLLNFGATKSMKPSEVKATRDLSKLTAKCFSLHRQSSNSLASLFKVSPEAMAIQLEELRLAPTIDRRKEENKESIYDLFVSYRREDKPFVERLVTDLQERGLRVWFDELLVAGFSWIEQIEEAIKKSRVSAVILGPRESSRSQALEIQTIVNCHLEKGQPIIPVFIPGREDGMNIPSFLGTFHWVDFRNNYMEALEQLVQSILNSGRGYL